MISQKVSQILESHWNWVLPVDIRAIAGSLGILVQNITHFDSNYDGLSGIAEIDQHGRRIIRSNVEESEQRQRFTLAHEIGHHVLGHVTSERHPCRDNSSNFNSTVNSSQEQDANNFAAQLLMPEEAIKILILRKGISDVEKLSKEFSVSGSAMYYRLKNLGYL